jgi:hypothetical protein
MKDSEKSCIYKLFLVFRITEILMQFSTIFVPYFFFCLCVDVSSDELVPFLPAF